MTAKKKTETTEETETTEDERDVTGNPDAMEDPGVDPDAPQRHPTTYDALVAVMREIDHVAKDGYNEHSNYNFRGIDGVLNAVGPAFRRHGIFPTSQIIDGPRWENVTTSGGKPANACRAIVRYRFHGPTDTYEADVATEAWDHGDKAAPKMMSVAMRTALIQVLALPTQEKDPDHDTYERGGGPQHEQTPTERALADLADVVADLGLDLPSVAGQLNREYGLPHAKKATPRQVEEFTQRLLQLHQKEEKDEQATGRDEPQAEAAESSTSGVDQPDA